MRLILVMILTTVPALAQSPHPVLLVLNKGASELAMVDPPTHRVFGRVKVGAYPHEVAVTSNGDRAVVSNYGGDEPGRSLSVIDVAAQKEIRRVDLGELRRPHGLAVTGREVYFTVEDNKAVGRLNIDTGRIDWLMGTGQDTTHMAVLSKDRQTLFTSNIGSNTVSVLQTVDTSGHWGEEQIAVGKGPEGMDISPDGKELWVAHSRDGGISIIDVAAKRVIQTLPALTKRSNRLKFTPDGKLVFVTDLDGGDLVILDARMRSERMRLHLGGQPEGILMQPDGSRAYVALWEEGMVVIVDVSKLTIAGKIQTGSGPDGMAWVP